MARKFKTSKATWKWALGDLALGRRSTEAVRAFDGLTNDMLHANRITLHEFAAAQTVIGAAYAAAAQLERIAP